MSAALATADVEAAAKTYLKLELVPELLAGRVFYSVPAGTPTLPLVELSELVTTTQRGEVGIGEHRLTFGCWARDKATAAAIKRALIGLLQQLDNTQLDASTYCYGVAEGSISSTWLPDNEQKLARYVVDVTLLCVPRAANPQG